MKQIAASCLFWACLQGQGQNLVPNGSFEEYDDCPTSYGQPDHVLGWTSPYNHSADYFNACAVGMPCSVPSNSLGYQDAADWVAYMGLATFSTLAGGYYREVIATELAQPLEPGVPVYISFMASPGGFGPSNVNSARWKARGPGMNFFTELPSDWHEYLFPNSAIVEMSAVLEDTSTWTTISGVYVPDSAYSFLAITGYFENDLCSASIWDSAGVLYGAYAYIDNVIISTSPTNYAELSGFAGSKDPELFVANPFAECLTITAIRQDMNGTELALLDMSGRSCWQGLWPLGQTKWTVPMSGLTAGPYMLQWTKPKTLRKAMRVIHVSP
jgi:hypothetical protein